GHADSSASSCPRWPARRGSKASNTVGSNGKPKRNLYRNRSGEDLVFEWVDYDGNPGQRENRSPTQTFARQTFAGHRFLASAADGVRIVMATAGIEQRRFVVTPELLEQGRQNAAATPEKPH